MGETLTLRCEAEITGPIRSDDDGKRSDLRCLRATRTFDIDRKLHDET